MREQIKSHIQTVREKMRIPSGQSSTRETPVKMEESRMRMEQDQEDADKVTKASHAAAKN